MAGCCEERSSLHLYGLHTEGGVWGELQVQGASPSGVLPVLLPALDLQLQIPLQDQSLGVPLSSVYLGPACPPAQSAVGV